MTIDKQTTLCNFLPTRKSISSIQSTKYKNLSVSSPVTGLDRKRKDRSPIQHQECKENRNDNLPSQPLDLNNINDSKACTIIDISRFSSSPSVDKPPHLLYDTPDKLNNTHYQPYRSPFTHTLSSSLPLPKSFEIMNKFQFALDHVCLFHQSRQRSSIFHRILKPIENICNRTIDTNHLKKLLYLMPDCYSVEPYDIQPFQKSFIITLIHHEQFNSNTDFTHDELEKRRELVYSRLLKIVNNEHERWCNAAGQTVPTLVRKWHPKFHPDNLALDLIPEANVDKEEKPTTPSICQPNVISPVNSPVTNDVAISKVFGVSSSLLERIRAKEKKRAEETMTDGKTESINRERYSEKLLLFVDSLSFLFNSSKKNVMPMHEICSKLVASSRTATSEHVILCNIQKLLIMVPQWIHCQNMNGSSDISTSSFIRMDRTISLASIKETINKS